MRTLFINSGGIGDQILLLPTVKLLKENFSDCEVDLITEPRSSCIGELSGLYRRIREFNFKEKNPNIFKLRELIRKRTYKYLISTGSSYKANFVAGLGSADVKIGFYSGLLSSLLLTHTVKLNTKQYTANMFAELLTPILPGVKNHIHKRDLIPEIKLSLGAIDWAKETLSPKIKEYHSKKIFIHPGVSKLSIQKNILKIFRKF